MSVIVSNFMSDVREYTQSISAGRLIDTAVRLYLNDFARESRRMFLLPWSRRTTELKVFEGIYNYAAPSDMVTPILPQRQISEDRRDDSYFQGMNQKDFARNNNSQNDFAVTWERTTKLLNIRYKNSLGSSVLHTMDDDNDNGTWSISGDSSTLIKDTGFFRVGAGSLRFNVTNSTNSVVLINSGMTAIDLDDDADISGFRLNSTAFLWLYLPITGLTGVDLRWGSSSSAYWSGVQQTANFDGTAFRVGWNLVGFPWDTATETGTVDESAINFARIALTGAATGVNYRVDHLVFKKFEQFDLPYYSNQLFTNSDGTSFKELVTANDDIILGDEDYIDAARKYVSMKAAQYNLKKPGLAEIERQNYQAAIRSLKIRYPSQETKIQSRYFPQHLLRG